MANIQERVLAAVTPLPFDILVARVYGQLRAHLEDEGAPLAEVDLQIAATAIHHGLELVTGNLRHFERIPGLARSFILAKSRADDDRS